ncbi:MAG: TspO/MBR family protein [bacterium]
MTNQTRAYSWYSTLIKPKWAPPSSVFGPVWSVLYVIIALTFGSVFYKVWLGQWAFFVAVPFILNLIFNLLFSPIQFGLKNNYFAAVDILFLLATLIWAMITVYPYSHRIVYLQIPYLLWVSFATVLQITITRLNR